MQSSFPPAFEAARQRVRAKMGWYRHLLYYLVVNLFLSGISVVSSPDDPWFIWPLLAWGAALAAHGIAVYLSPSDHVMEDSMAGGYGPGGVR
ncbi:MAG: 2TM domain-containing protein [Thermodesulfobacteriota bacterium]